MCKSGAISPDRPHTAACCALLAGVLALTACHAGEVPPTQAHAPPQRIARGQLLLAQYQCSSCHAIPGVATASGIAFTGPTLAAFGRRSYIAGHIPNGPDALARWIVAPEAQVPHTLMPSMGVSPADAQAMAAYLLQLK